MWKIVYLAATLLAGTGMVFHAVVQPNTTAFLLSTVFFLCGFGALLRY